MYGNQCISSTLRPPMQALCCILHMHTDAARLHPRIHYQGRDYCLLSTSVQLPNTLVHCHTYPSVRNHHFHHLKYNYYITYYNNITCVVVVCYYCVSYALHNQHQHRYLLDDGDLIIHGDHRCKYKYVTNAISLIFLIQ